ncbi:Killer cell lectin-like receptor subfamily B member 1A [Cricetulus griseus]|uniref:Killer cell lectin-like receptor subfamily B member 1A n=1 Tax=Cricetulus griseus TaxID=10029 RepID=G3GUH9_CRIGR|nr:Killer cell lectin-like receptor subfamily B member 1A [Cricetulus griseus]
MDTSKVYLNLKASRSPEPQRASPPCLPPVCINKYFSCSRDWLLHRDKCIHFSQDSHIWKRGLADCATKGATFLLIRDQEELVSSRLQITGEAKKDSCAAVSKNKVFSDACASHNMWICQKEPKLVSETVCNDS